MTQPCCHTKWIQELFTFRIDGMKQEPFKLPSDTKSCPWCIPNPEPPRPEPKPKELAEVLLEAWMGHYEHPVSWEEESETGKKAYRAEAKAAIEWCLEMVNEKELANLMYPYTHSDNILHLAYVIKFWLKQQWTKDG